MRWYEMAEAELTRLNVVRSGRPEQLAKERFQKFFPKMSQCSPVWKTGTMGRARRDARRQALTVSM